MRLCASSTIPFLNPVPTQCHKLTVSLELRLDFEVPPAQSLEEYCKPCYPCPAKAPGVPNDSRCNSSSTEAGSPSPDHSLTTPEGGMYYNWRDVTQPPLLLGMKQVPAYLSRATHREHETGVWSGRHSSRNNFSLHGDGLQNLQ
ncbi:hypothetical protein AVEN_146314-1 [Araneus ventricosus]|uniref:Uncharacterized protein n=1 Tax=Araneus ventricosus TaxID=182803 RepID=A0A4Y2I0V0_ARAVE|nr:hypothetical protein AVEN_146314-1 [Araneus ventricosus]